MGLPESFVKNMRKYQEPNGIPIFLKGGAFDKGLFGVTVALCGLGVIGFANFVYKFGFAKKK